MPELLRVPRRVIAELTLERFEERTEWPLAAAAAIFLAAYSVEVLALPQGHFRLEWNWSSTSRTRFLWWITCAPESCHQPLLIYAVSLAILETERGQPGAEINNFGDAVWWSITTVTTVGYGGLAPVTVKGRVIAVLLTMGGISLVGVVTATLASWIVQRVAQEDTVHRAATAAQIEALRTGFQQEIQTLRADILQLIAVVTPAAPQRPNERTDTAICQPEARRPVPGAL